MNALKELKEVCNKIVGQWYCEEIGQHLIFDLNDKLLKMARLTVMVESKIFETEYGIALKINSDPYDDKKRFYFDVGNFEKRYFEIISLTKEMLVVSEFFMKVGTNSLPPIIYKRITTLDFADEILKGLDSK